MWGDIGATVDIRYYSVAPHWYFRPFMSWLIACPHHKTGIFGLIFFFVVLFFQPNIQYKPQIYPNNTNKFFFLSNYLLNVGAFIYVSREFLLQNSVLFGYFIMAALYTVSFLPYGRFYNRLGGNICTLFSYLFIFCYLGFGKFRNNLTGLSN